MNPTKSHSAQTLCAGIAAALLLVAVSCHAQGTQAATVALRVAGESGAPVTLDLRALDRLPQRTVHASAHGKDLTCTGPAMIDVLGSVGTHGGDAIRGKNLALYVRVSAADGYRAVLALAELDPGFRSEVPIVTARCDGHALDAKDGPLRVIVPGDQRPARWVRQLTALEVLRAPD